MEEELKKRDAIIARLREIELVGFLSSCIRRRRKLKLAHHTVYMYMYTYM